MNLKGALHWAGEHPVPTTIGVFAGGLLILWLLGAFKGGGSSSSSSALGAAYYNAVGVQAQSSNALMATQSTNAAAVAQSAIAAKATTDVQSFWANVSTLQANNNLASSLATTAATKDVNLAQITANQNLGLAQIGSATTLGLATTDASKTVNLANLAAQEHLSDNALDLGKYQADTSLIQSFVNGPLTTVLNAGAHGGIAQGEATFSTAGGQFVGIQAAPGIVQSAGDLAAKGFSPGQIAQLTGVAA